MNGRLRVLLLINGLRVGGAERQLIELAKGLDRRRFDVMVGTLYSGWSFEDELAGRDDLRLVSLDRRHKYDIGTLPKLARLLRRERIDIIMPFLTPATFFGLSAALLARTPVRIATERTGTGKDHAGLGSNIYSIAQDRLARRADLVVANSESGRQAVIARGVELRKTRVIYNGVSADRVTVTDAQRAEVRRELGLPTGARVAGIVARLEPMKQHETFLRAAARVREVLPNAYFLIVGDGSLRSALEARARELGLDGHARFLGDRLTVAPYIDLLDVAALSSSGKEGCSNFLLEAMALGKPSVCTDIGGNPEVIVHGQTGLLVPPGDPERFADALLLLLTDTDRGRRMGEHARRAFDGRFSVGQMVRAYEQLYDELWSLRTHAALEFERPVEQHKVVK